MKRERPTSAPVAGLSRRSLLALLGLSTLSACRVVEWRARGLSRKLERHELEHARLELGDGIELGYWAHHTHHTHHSHGRGEPILLLHGFGASGMWQWHHQIPALVDAGYAPIVPDLLWFGESRDRKRDFRVARQVEAMRGLLDHLELDTVHVAGISYGGIVAHDLSVRAHDRVETSTLISSPARAFRASDQARLLERYDVGSIDELLLPSTPEDVSRLFNLAYADPPKLPRVIRRQVVEHFYEEARAERRALLAAISASIEELRVLEWVPDQPTLIIWGREDQVFPLPASERISNELGAAAHLVVLDGAGHAPNLEHPERVNDLLLHFLSGNRIDPRRPPGPVPG